MISNKIYRHNVFIHTKFKWAHFISSSHRCIDDYGLFHHFPYGKFVGSLNHRHKNKCTYGAFNRLSGRWIFDWLHTTVDGCDMTEKRFHQHRHRLHRANFHSAIHEWAHIHIRTEKYRMSVIGSIRKCVDVFTDPIWAVNGKIRTNETLLIGRCV